MTRSLRVGEITSTGLLIVVTAIVSLKHAQAQVRGVYPLGMSATNSGVTPEPGITYSNQLLIYSRDQLKDPNGHVIATGNNSVIMDMNTLTWVSKKKFMGGAKFSMSATFPIANNSLTSDVAGEISGGGGLADSFYQPVILGWDYNRVAVRAIYGFLAPTGSFRADANDNVGSGYWTQTLASGQTFYLTENKATSVSAFQLYEFHSTQKESDIQPGQTLNLDYSLTHAIRFGRESSLQVGLVGYNSWQTNDKSGPNITPQQAKAHYRVNALGVASNVMLPAHKLSVGFKYFKEFSNRSTFEGHSIQMSASIHF
jgi:hypothetical protein